MIEGKLKSGFEYKIEDHVLNNMELLDAVSEVDENPMVLSKVIKILLGTEQRKNLYDHLRDPEKGNVPITAVSEAVAEIFSGSGQLKN